jgi:hypothetical protein
VNKHQTPEQLPALRSRAAVVRRFALLLSIGLVLVFGVAPADADPNPDVAGAKAFDLNCGDTGTFRVVFVESHLGAFHVVGESTSIFQSTSLTIEGEPIFAEPGSSKNGRAELSCRFVGTLTGRLFTVTGFFTPRRG